MSARVPVVAVLIVLLARATTMAQGAAEPPPATEPDRSGDPAIQFLPRSAFHLGAEHVSSGDLQFIWDTNFGGEIDFVDYGVGRATFAGNYQAILGHEFRRFDPNQGSYRLEGATSARVGGLEVAAVFLHVSRHLSDRPKRFAIDWNMIGGRVEKVARSGAIRTDARVDLRHVLVRSFVDYSWEVDGDVRNLYGTGRIAAVSDIGLRLVGTNGSHNRGTQTGLRGEGGIRLQGRGSAVELYVAAERRVDPFPLVFATDSWIGAGFRLLSR